MFDPSRPILKDLDDLEFDSSQTAKLVMDHITFEVYKVPDETYTFRVWHHQRDRAIVLMFGCSEEDTEAALYRAQLIDSDPDLLRTLAPTIH